MEQQIGYWNKKPKLSKNSFTYDEILHAYMQCRKHKRNTKSQLEFEKNFMDKLQNLLQQINSRTYDIGKYTCFAVMHPKPREVWAAPFKERIIHHLIHNELKDEFEKHFIDQTYACIKNRGTLKAIMDAFKGVRKITKNYTEEAYYIKLDIQNYFVSINKDILWNILKEKIDENSLLGWLVHKSIFANFTKNPKIKNKQLLKKVPEYKQLSKVEINHQGLPIGNLTSQFYSNIYLNELDHYCKHKLKLKYYYRYADDILILTQDKHNIHNTIENINIWLKENRNLYLNTSKTIINTCTYGIKFLGSRLFYHYILPSEKILYRCKSLCKRISRIIFNKDLYYSLNSYLGLLSVLNTYRIRKRFLSKCYLNLIYNNTNGKICYLKEVK